MKWWIALVLFMVIASICNAGFHPDKQAIGAVEEVVLLPWGLKLHARVDTGAATSSLSVSNVIVTNGVVEFSLPDGKSVKHFKVALLEWRTIKSSDGIEEARPVVKIVIMLAGKKIRSQVTLDDRSKMSYPMLIGRRTLKGRFVVDVERTKAEAVESEEGVKE